MFYKTFDSLNKSFLGINFKVKINLSRILFSINYYSFNSLIFKFKFKNKYFEIEAIISKPINRFANDDQNREIQTKYTDNENTLQITESKVSDQIPTVRLIEMEFGRNGSECVRQPVVKQTIFDKLFNTFIEKDIRIQLKLQ